MPLTSVTWYYAILLTATLGALGVAALPWRTLFERGWGIPAMYAWSVADIGLITVLMAVAGGAESPVFVVYVFTTVFFAASYPVSGQLVLAAFTAACYVAVAAVAGPVTFGNVALRVLLLALIAHMAGFLSRELLAVSEVADRRGRLLGQVAAASRHLHRLDHEAVLEGALDAALGLGWDAASLELVDRSDPGQAVVQHARGLPPGYGGAQARGSGLIGQVARAQAPVTAADYATLEDADPAAVRAGIRTTVGLPVTLRGEFAGALFAGSFTVRRVDPVDIEALELLAAAVSLALDNAATYADQQHAAGRLADLDRAKTDFLVTASHELRTPLTVADGMAQTLRQRWAELDDETRSLLLDRLGAGMDQLRSIVDTLLDYARASVADPDRPAGPTPADVAVHTAVNRAAQAAPGRRIEVFLEPVAVQAEPTILDRVLQHLLTNALTHTPESSAIRVGATQTAPGVVRFTVSDEGPGMTPDDLGRAEGDFVRGGDADTRPSGGLGLGLPLVRRLLAIYHAELRLDSTPETGTTASFALPLSPDPVPATGKDSPEPAPANG